MSPVAAFATGLALALLIAGAWIGWMWKARLHRFETAEGLRILSAMRWRELSNIVVDALTASGFVRESTEQQHTRGAAGDVAVYRDGRPWVLTCRQGMGHVVTRASAEEFGRQVRAGQMAGGVIVTPGQVEPQARLVGPHVELLDGEELWKLVGPLLPGSVHTEVAGKARSRALRATGTALAAATMLGLGFGFLLGRVLPGDAVGDVVAPVTTAVTGPRATNAPAAAPAPTPAAAPTTEAPMSEDEERESIVREIGQLPGVDRALWSTRSTLHVFLNDPTVATDAAICSVMKRYELLRPSRLQIESPAGSERPIRFMQCSVY